MALKGRRFNDLIKSEAKLHNALLSEVTNDWQIYSGL
jgi:hypothetical protein